MEYGPLLLLCLMPVVIGAVTREVKAAGLAGGVLGLLFALVTHESDISVLLGHKVYLGGRSDALSLLRSMLPEMAVIVGSGVLLSLIGYGVRRLCRGA